MASLTFDEQLILNYRDLERECEGGDSDSNEGSPVNQIVPEMPKATDEDTDKSTPTQAFFALDRVATEEILTNAIKHMDDLTLKNAVHTLLSSYKPHLLEALVKTRSTLSALAEAVFIVEDKAKEVPKNEIVHEEPEMRKATDKNIKRLMKEEGLDEIQAWTQLRCLELEDGASICCSEECSDRDEADEDLCAAYRRGDEKRAARHRTQGKQVWKRPEEEEVKDSVVVTPYVAPPKVRDAEFNWPFMRCKNVVNALQRSQATWMYGNPPKNHHGLLEYIAKIAKLDVETLKNTSPHEVFKGNYYITQALGKSSRW
jgi:hypothetical protein